MSAGIGKSKASGIALMGKVLVGVMVVGVGIGGGSRHAYAATSDTQFHQYLLSICLSPTVPASWDAPKVLQMCLAAFPNLGGPVDGGTAPSSVSANLGTVNAGGSLSSRKKQGARIPLDEQKDSSVKGASADGGGWGLLISPQYSKNSRTGTDLENGYQSSLKGLNVGLDYRSSDSFVFGAIIGQTKDDATFLNNAGSLKTRNNTVVLYSTWLPSEAMSVDGYLGYGKINFDSSRRVAFGTGISGAINGATTGKQLMAGLSTSYQMTAGRLNIAPFFNLDYINTSFKGYSETGTTLLELRYSDRRTASLTSSLGGRFGTTYNYEWGALIPSIRLAAVHEFQNNSKRISNELVITPGTSMVVTTDAPDRNYLNLGLGVAASLNSGAQLFLDYEKRTQDKLLSSWAVSLGGLFEF